MVPGSPRNRHQQAGKVRAAQWVVNGGAWLLLALLMAWSVLPIYLIVSSAFKDPRTIFAYPPRFVFKPVLDNFVTLWQTSPGFFEGLRNSLIVTLGAALLTLLVSFPAAYVFSRYSSRWLGVAGVYLLAVRMMPPIVITIPLFPVLNQMGLVDTHILLIVLYATFFVSLSTWLIKAFIDEIPIEIEESASLEGCNLWQLMRYIVLPLTRQGIAACAIFVAVYAWNEFLFAFLFTSTQARTAPIAISEMMGSVTGVAWGPLLAAATVQLIPILILVWLAQKHLIRGMTIGSVKG